MNEYSNNLSALHHPDGLPSGSVSRTMMTDPYPHRQGKAVSAQDCLRPRYKKRMAEQHHFITPIRIRQDDAAGHYTAAMCPSVMMTALACLADTTPCSRSRSGTRQNMKD
jgi:hypothetical protein